MEAGNIGRYNLRRRDRPAESLKTNQEGKTSSRKNATGNKYSQRALVSGTKGTKTAVAEVPVQRESRKRNGEDLEGGFDSEREVKRGCPPNPLPPTPKSEKRKTRKWVRGRNRRTSPVQAENTIIDSNDSVISLSARSFDSLHVDIAEPSNVERPFQSAPASVSSFEEAQRRHAAAQRLHAQRVLQSPWVYNHKRTFTSFHTSEVREPLVQRKLDFEKPGDDAAEQPMESLMVLANVASTRPSEGAENPVGLPNIQSDQTPVQAESEILPAVVDNPIVPSERQDSPGPVQELVQTDAEFPFDLHEIVPNLFLGSYVLEL